MIHFAHLGNLSVSHYRVARYEDIADDPSSQSKELLEFFGFQMHPNIESFIESHTKNDTLDTNNKTMPWSTFRDSKSAPYHWKEDLSFEEVAKIQSECVDALRLWGYQTVSSEQDLHDGTNKLRTACPLSPLD